MRSLASFSIAGLRNSITSTVFMLLVSISVYSQELASATALVDSIKAENTFYLRSISTPINPSKKDVYIEEGWQHGVLVTDDENTLFFNGRINVVRGYLECKVENRIRKIAPGRIKLIDLEGKKYIPIKGSSIDGGGINTYMNILSLGQISLLKGYYIIVKSRGGDSINQEITGTETLELGSDLFYTYDFGTIYRLRSNKKTILSLLSDKEDQVSNLIEINRLKFSSDRDISTIFNFYNTID